MQRSKYKEPKLSSTKTKTVNVAPKKNGIKKDQLLLGISMASRYFKEGSFISRKNSNPLDYQFTKCIYCRRGTFQHSEPTDWTSCDVCDRWVHQKCLPPDSSFSGNFLCKYCDSYLNNLQYVLEETSYSEKMRKLLESSYP